MNQNSDVTSIRTIGHEILRRRARPVEEVSTAQFLAQKLKATLEVAGGLGLSAPQIGVRKRVFVARRPTEEVEEARLFVNPVVTERSEVKTVATEGCLSVPGMEIEVSRPHRVALKFQNEAFEEDFVEAEGVFARILLQEHDHLEGGLITDALTSFQRRIRRGKLHAIKRGDVETDYPIKTLM